MNTLNLTGLGAAERFVRKQQALGNDVRWDGWDMVFFRPAEQGMTSPQGAFRNGQWGFDNRFGCDDQGVWRIDYRNVKRSRNPRT